uniref:Cyclin N-terminal domain-containing protein n=1 Tax=Macrostomum lignano TaxID=282301 RepID=A0A1I8ISB2_9PLAT
WQTAPEIGFVCPATAAAASAAAVRPVPAVLATAQSLLSLLLGRGGRSALRLNAGFSPPGCQAPFCVFSVVKYCRETTANRSDAASASDAVRQSQQQLSGSTSPTLDLTASLPTFQLRLDEGQLSVSSGGSGSGSGSGISGGLTPYKRFVSADEYSQLAAVSGAGKWFRCIGLCFPSPHLVAYHPHLLDNPELVCGKHRTVLNFSSFRTSLLSYVRPSDLKRDLNQQFRDRFPQVQLTLSKLRSLKAVALRVSRKAGLDTWAVAQAYVFFDKLALKGFVNKLNRRHSCAVSLVLSAKLNDIKGPDLTVLLQELESAFRLSRREILSQEMAALLGLEFSLAVPDYEVLSHQQRIVSGGAEFEENGKTALRSRLRSIPQRMKALLPARVSGPGSSAPICII